MKLFPGAGIVAVVFIAATAYAATRPRAVLLADHEFFQPTTPSGIVSCGLVGGKWIPGILGKSTSRLFTSRAAQLRALQKDRNAASTVSARAKIEKRISKLQKTQRREAPYCKSGPTPTPTATPAPAPVVPTVTPTPTPVVQGCYDQSRNTTCFGIPNGIEGNETLGLSLFTSNCLGCHNGSLEPEPRNFTYSQIDSSFSTVTQMNLYIGSFSPTQVAHLTAYLNRFNPNQ
jgi:hypothetical protein